MNGTSSIMIYYDKVNIYTARRIIKQGSSEAARRSYYIHRITEASRLRLENLTYNVNCRTRLFSSPLQLPFGVCLHWEVNPK